MPLTQAHARQVDVALIDAGHRVDRDTAHHFEIEPPALERIARAVAIEIVLVGDRFGKLGMLDRQPHEFFRFDRVLAIPRTHFHAAPAGRTLHVGDAILGAFLDVSLPDLVAVEHHLGAEGNGVAGALARALAAAFAKILQPEIDRQVDRHRQVGGEHHRFRARPDKWVEDGVTDAADLAQARHQDRRVVNQLRVRVGVRAGGVAHAPAMRGHQAGDFRATHVGAHRLRGGDPVIARSAFHGLVALVEQHNHRIVVVCSDRLAFDLVVRVIHPGRGAAYAYKIGAEEIAQCLDGVGVALRVGQIATDAAGHKFLAPALHRHHLLDQWLHAERVRVLHRKAHAFALRLLTQIASLRALEKITALRDAPDLVGQHQRAGRPAAGNLLHRVAAQVQWPLVQLGVPPLRPGPALAHAHCRVVGFQRAAGDNRCIAGEFIVGGHQRQPKAAANEWRRQLCAVGTHHPRAHREALDVDQACAIGMAARGKAHPAQIAGQDYSDLGGAQVGAGGVAAGDPVAARVTGMRLAAELDQKYESMGMRGLCGAQPVAGFKGADRGAAGVEKVGRGFEIVGASERIVGHRGA